MTLSAGTWYHVAIVYAASGSQKIYIDGVERATSSLAENLIVNNDPLQIGADQGFSDREFDGRIDEVRVYNAALSVAQVGVAMAETRPCPIFALAYYNMDELTWGSVLDSSGNGYDGVAVGTAVPVSSSPVVVGSPGTCGYGEIPFNNSAAVFDAVDTSVDIDDDVGDVGSISFWYKSNVPWAGNNGDRQLFDASDANSGKYFYLNLRNNSRLNFGLEDTADGDFRFEGGGNNFVAGVWVHIAVTWDLPNDAMQIYVNGSLNGSQIFSTNGSLGELDTLYFGDNRSAYIVRGMTGRSANGSIDEARIYSTVRSQAEIQADMNATHPCGSTLDHFVISHDGLGINCLAETITVTAKLADNSTYTGYTGNIVLDTQSLSGTWTLNTGTPANFNDVTPADGLATYTFDMADNGIALFYLDYQSGAASIDIDAYDGATRDDDLEGNLLFSPSGITVTAAALTNPPPGVINTIIPAQTAAINFTLYLAAYGQTPTDTTCGIIESYTSGQNINFWSIYNNPASGTLQVAVNGSNVATSEGASAPQAVTFTNGQASITVNYPDVGQMTLGMKDDTTANPDLPNGIAGGSDPFVVRPAGFVLSNIMRSSDSFPNPGTAVDQTGARFIAAGENMTVTVTAVNSLGNPTPNYGQESAAESVLLTSTLVAAGGVNNPPVNFSTGFNGFVNGVDTGTDFNWPEVGIITLTPSVFDADYLGTGDVTGTVSANVGRFYPADFEISATTANFATQCGSFTYMRQSFGYNTAPVVTVTARAAGGATTTNYDGVWWQLGDFSETYSHNGVLPGTASLDASAAGHVALNCVNCVGAGTATFTGNFTYDTSSLETAPFMGAVDIDFTLPADVDGACYDATANPCNTNNGDTPQAFSISAIGFNSGAQQLSGQAVALDVHGSYAIINDVLTMPVVVRNYVNVATGWAVNAVDNCTSYPYTQVDNGITTNITPVSSVSLLNGVGDLAVQLTADAGATGGVTTVNFTWDAWLNGTPSATATFGIFRGDDRYLYWRESP